MERFYRQLQTASSSLNYFPEHAVIDAALIAKVEGVGRRRVARGKPVTTTQD
jgi:hypothetical protein